MTPTPTKVVKVVEHHQRGDDHQYTKTHTYFAPTGNPQYRVAQNRRLLALRESGEGFRHVTLRAFEVWEADLVWKLVDIEPRVP